MKRRARRYAFAALLLGLSHAFLGANLSALAADDAAKAQSAAGEGAAAAKSAAAADAEFDGECVMGLALGKDIKTDCSVSTVYNGKTFCFGNETARTLFLKKPDEFLLQAHIYYSSKQPAP